MARARERERERVVDRRTPKAPHRAQGRSFQGEEDQQETVDEGWRDVERPALNDFSNFRLITGQTPSFG
jgi:hypothetical protein